jgi:transposase, IS6 family
VGETCPSVRRSRMEGQGEGVRWYLMFPVSYRDLELMLQDRAVDSRGQTPDFLLSAKRDAEVAKRFFRKALAPPQTVNPRTITVDKNAAYPEAASEMKKDGELWRRSRLRQVKYLNNIVEQDHRNVKRLTCPGLGFGSFWTARRTLAGYEVMAMIRKGQVRNIGGRDIKAQAKFIAALFEVAA